MILLILLLLGGPDDYNYRAKIQEAQVKEYQAENQDTGRLHTAKVSWYGEEYCRKYNPACITASGVRFDETALVCACSNDYLLGSYFRFSYRGNSVIVECTDRGSFKEKYNRDFDLSKGAFEALTGNLGLGVIEVKVEEK